MSYEHCDEHDEDATNGCASCYRECVDALLSEIREMIERGAPFSEIDAAFMEVANERLAFSGSVFTTDAHPDLELGFVYGVYPTAPTSVMSGKKSKKRP